VSFRLLLLFQTKKTCASEYSNLSEIHTLTYSAYDALVGISEGFSVGCLSSHGFVGDSIRGENPHAVVIHDDAWVWTAVDVVTTVHKIDAFFGDPTNISKIYAKANDDDVKKVDTPMLLLIPAELVEWLSSTRHTPWDLHKKLQETVTEAGFQDTPETIKMSLEWCLKAGQIPSGTRDRTQ